MRTRWLIAGVLIAVGLVWIGQGTGFFGGTGGMNDDIKWAFIGAVLIVIGAVIGARETITRKRVV